MDDDNKPIGNNDWLKDFRLTDEVKCEVADCKNDAFFYTQFRCCRLVFIACRMHTSALIHKVTTFAQRGTMVNCGWCREVVNPNEYLYRPEPLTLDKAS